MVQKQALLDVLAVRTVELLVGNMLDVNPDRLGKVIWDPSLRSAILRVSDFRRFLLTNTTSSG